jgi:hypothetical protein
MALRWGEEGELIRRKGWWSMRMEDRWRKSRRLMSIGRSRGEEATVKRERSGEGMQVRRRVEGEEAIKLLWRRLSLSSH